MTLDVGMEEIGGGGTNTRPTQIALVFGAGSNCIGNTVGWEMNARQSAKGRYTTIINGRMGRVENRKRRLSKCQTWTTQ